MATNNSVLTFYSLKNHATHSEMKKINLAEFVSEKYGRELSDENKSAILIEQKLRGILDRAGPHIREIDFNHSWPVISQTILENIKEKCFQLTKLEMGWVRINADISPLLEHVAPQLEEFSLEESSWIGENARQNEAKVAQYFPKMHNLRRLNLRKFGGPLDDLVKIEGKLEFLDVSEARQLDADTLVNFLNLNNQLICLHLCPMPRQCLQLVAASTTSAINVPTAFLGFTKQEIRERQRYKEENGNIPVRRPKKGKAADLQTLIGQIGKMPKLRTLWLGYIPYTSHFLEISPLGNAPELKHLHLKECMALDGTSLKTILGGILKEQLRQLSILNCQRLEEFSALSLCTSLTQLDIEKSKTLNDEALKGLAQNGSLRILRINECPKVHDSGVLAIVSNCPSLKELELIKCSGISSQLFSNVKAFCNSDRFERLSLSGCEAITTNSIKQLISTIKLDKLQQLDLSQNMNLDDSVLEMLKESLEKANKLYRKEKLVLTVCCSGTGITRQFIKKYEPLMEIVFY